MNSPDQPRTAREVRWERMFPDELERAFAECPVAYFTYGLCEPHGPHNALGLDALNAHAIACKVAETYGGIVAPPDYWHIHALGGYAIWAHVGTRLYGLPDFEANVPGFDGDGNSGDHAGKVETSLLWALDADCVDVSRLPPTDQPGPHFAMGKDAKFASRRIGERMAADEVRWLGQKAQALLSACDHVKPAHTLRTFEQVEQLSDDVVRPALKDFRSMQDSWQGEPPPIDSVWRENWRVPQRGF